MAERVQRTITLYEAAVKEIRLAGTELTPMDYAHLWQAAREAVGFRHDGPPALLAPDVTVADAVVLHAPPVGCLLWWEEFGEPAFADNEREAVIGLAWMLAHAEDEKLFRRTTSKRQVLRAVRWWAFRLPWHITPADLAWGVSAVLDGPEPPPTARVKTSPSSATWGELVASVAHEYHLSPEEVAWRVPVAQLREMVCAAGRRNGGEDTAATEAFVRFREFVRELKARPAEENDG